MKARVTVTLKTGILDPQGKAIEGALKSLGVDGVASVRQGKVFDIEIAGSDKAKAEAALKEAADKLLANTVIENSGFQRNGHPCLHVEVSPSPARDPCPPAVRSPS